MGLLTKLKQFFNKKKDQPLLNAPKTSQKDVHKEDEFIKKLQENRFIQNWNNGDQQMQDTAKKIISILVHEKNEADAQNRQMFSEKNKYTNVPISINEHTVYINTITVNGSMFPYILVYPETIDENCELIVDTLNTLDTHSTKEREVTFIDGAEQIGKYVRSQINAPMLYVHVPKENNNDPYYQHLSRECFTSDGLKYPRCDLLVKQSILDAQKKLKSISGKDVSDKIVLNGYSTSGVFAQRFAKIHPEMVSKAIIGAATGSIPIPTNDLDWPEGIRDFEELFGKKFDEESYKKIEFAYYVGELEAKEASNRRDENGNIVPKHDMSYLPKSVPEDIGAKYREMFGINLNERFANAINWYKQHGYKIISKIYKGADHRSFKKGYTYYEEYIKDLELFYQEGITGEGFKKGKASADKIKTDFDDYVR